MKPKVGQYFYAPHGQGFRIYCYDYVSDTGALSSPAMGEATYFEREEARKRVYELNGWRYKNELTNT